MSKQTSKYHKGQLIRSLDELWMQDVVFLPIEWFQEAGSKIGS